ncbi:MAG: hypothetical protein CMB67_00050 [Euryarchaeota archaeon]|nr:hypothetical protein [Euryarchaeota archaeon]
MSWDRVLGRVSFINCEPIFHSLDSKWRVLSAPPSWLTGHLLRNDCITAPIPTADYSSFSDDLNLIREIGIVGRERVGSVILFGRRDLESMRDIALPSDSSTSSMLLKWLLNQRGLDPKFIEMGPDISSMLESCDGALIIGDRAITSSIEYPDLVRMDLGSEWNRITELPMVFGVFASRKDSPPDRVDQARSVMLNQYNRFLSEPEVREKTISIASSKVGLTEVRISKYYDEEVSNLLDEKSVMGLEAFLETVCEQSVDTSWF